MYQTPNKDGLARIREPVAEYGTESQGLVQRNPVKALRNQPFAADREDIVADRVRTWRVR